MDGAHTHGSGGTGLAELAVIGAAVITAVIIAPLVALILHLLIIAVFVLAGAAGLALAVILGWHLSHRHRDPRQPPWQQGTLRYQQSHAVRPPERSRAVEAPRELHVHLHAMPEDIADAIRRLQVRGHDQ